MCAEILLQYQELCNKRDFMLCFMVCNQGNFPLLPHSIVVVYVSGIKASLEHLTQNPLQTDLGFITEINYK